MLLLQPNSNQGRKILKIQLPSGLIHLIFQLPPIKYYLPNRCTMNVSKVCLDFKLIHAFKSMFCSSCNFEFANCFWLEIITNKTTDSVLRLRISLAHQTTKLQFSLVQEQSLFALDNLTWVFSCPANICETHK